MDELVRLVQQKTGLSEQQSREAVSTVINFLKTRLPAPVADNLDTIISTNTAIGDVEDLAKGLGGMFGKK